MSTAQTPPTNLKLPTVISDHMVLQADRKDAVWGWSPAGASVKVEFLDAAGSVASQGTATAAANGRWSTALGPLKSGATGQLRVTAGTEVKTVEDVLVGETWLCGGQSNMTYTVQSDNVAPSVISMTKQEATAAQGNIRYLYVDGKGTPAPQDDVGGRWQVATPQSVGGCSAVGWNFAVALRDKLHCPVGLIISAVGGTRAEQWMPKESFSTFPEGIEMVKRYAQYTLDVEEQKKKFETDLAAWQQANATPDLQAQNDKTKPRKPGDVNQPSELYNAMIVGLEPYTIKGILWFQADGNMDRPQEYGSLIKALILAWRKDWKEELPFYYVEMNNMRDDTQQKPVQLNDLSLLRETQRAALELPHTGVVCSIDCGNANEPHFPNKKPVGQRLAGLALRDVYGQTGLVDSPTYKSFTVEDKTVRLKIDHAEGLHVRAGYPFHGFAIREENGDWQWADGKIDGQDIIVWSDRVNKPIAVRYAWAMNPITSIENGSNLPLFPFRTDTESPK